MIERVVHGNRYRFDVIGRGEAESGKWFVVHGTNVDAGGVTAFRGAGEVWERTVRDPSTASTTRDFVVDGDLIAALAAATSPRRL